MSEQEAMDVKDGEEDSFSNSPEGLSDDEDADDEKVNTVKKQLESSPYTYELHIQLITLCRKLGDLDELRKARENMSKLFPLTPELWLDWLTDEEKLAVTSEEKEKLDSLFERAVKDYMSVFVWLEYVQYSIRNMGEKDGTEKVRSVFERALTAVGIHVAQGSLVWEAYREFENALLLSIESTEENEDKIKEQRARVFNIYKRQLSVPLLYMNKTYKEFKNDFEDQPHPSIDHSYQKALKKMDRIQPYEDALFKSEAPRTKEYMNYITFELKEGDPIRVQNIYDRALVENCLKPELWDQYTKYLDRKVKIGSISLPVHERAVRNCPWCINLWINYGRALEHYNEPHTAIVEIFETALQAGIAKADDFKELWLAYLDYMRRRIKSDGDNTTELEEITAVFERASEHMTTYFRGSESEYTVMKYWAFIEAKYRKNIKRARELWEETLSHEHNREAHMWLDYANFERIYGDSTHYRKVLLKALYAADDCHETIVTLLITHEREEGTLESLDAIIEKCESQMRHINEKRFKKMEEVAKHKKREDKRSGRHKPSKHHHTLTSEVFRSISEHTNNRRGSDTSNIPVQMDSEGFKIPPPPPDRVLFTPESRSEVATTSPVVQCKREAPEDDVPKAKKQKTETDTSHGAIIEHDPTKDNRTVFLSNLSYSLEEDKIRESFSKVGDIQEIRLVRDYKGRCKGYCYVVYTSQKDAKIALEKDREMLDGRPVYVSPCKDKKQNPTSQPIFKFGTGLEKNKLFIKGLPFSTTKEELEEMFKQYGTVKDVRLVTYRNGHSKGLAYVEYEDEAAAATAIVKTDGSSVEDHIISVAISNPPSRKPKKEYSGGGVTVSRSLGGRTSDLGPRGKGRTQVSLLPRALLRPQASKTPPTSTQQQMQNGQSKTSTSAETNLSNSDFRNMLLNK